MHLTSDRATPKVVTAIAMQNQLASPLLRLPAEIRNRIYEYTLYDTCIRTCLEGKCAATYKSHPDTHAIQHDNQSYGFPPKLQRAYYSGVHVHFPKAHLQLLQVCQQIYAEARLLVFSLNELTGDVQQVDAFLENDIWGPTRMDAIEMIKLESHQYDPCFITGCGTGKIRIKGNLSLRGFAKLQNLKKVTFQLCFDGPKHEAHEQAGVMLKELVEEAINEGRPADKIIKLEFIFEQL